MTDYRCSRSTQVMAGIFVAGALLARPAAGEPHAVHQLASADTTIVVAAGAHAPRLLSLGWRGKAQWRNREDEPLPDHVVTDAGESLPLAWRFNAALSSGGHGRVSLVYDSLEPRLRL